MSSNHFFTNIEINKHNENFLYDLEQFSENNFLSTYLIKSPLGEKKYSYDYSPGMILLIPNHKIIVINNSSEESEDFDDYFEDFFEDLGHLSDRYDYLKVLGRPRKWKQTLLGKLSLNLEDSPIFDFLEEFKISDSNQIRQIDFLISLCIGSINSIERFSEELPTTFLEKVKQSIVLFDSDQTRFIFEKNSNSRITIQGLAGTGKTELLLHKLKELYTENPTNKIVFTCFNKTLANSLKTRVPAFFDFMKVEEQIKWNERLWVMHGWGSKNNEAKMGTYGLICKEYDIPFMGYSNGSFDQACKNAIEFLERKDEIKYLFDYILIDESQDFQESFFKLCEMVTKKQVYVAGDIFQNIFQPNVTETPPNFLLNKCYRTDPRTLMLAHGVGFGLFEEYGIRKLTERQWEACGYSIEEETSDKISLKRKTLRKFTDLNVEEFESVEIVPYNQSDLIESIFTVIDEIKDIHPGVNPDDIAIIVVDKGSRYFDLMDTIGVHLDSRYDWKINSIYSSKQLKKGTLSISNTNNVKGLEFPFVICISNEKIGDNVKKRNALYMALTRSFVSSYLLVNNENNEQFIEDVSDGLDKINSDNKLIFNPNKKYIDQSKLILDVNNPTVSQKDVVDEVLQELIERRDNNSEKLKSTEVQKKLRDIVFITAPESINKSYITQIIITNLNLIH